jgi:IS30 family transposase
MNGLVRQYLPKGTDLSVYSQAQLDAIADQINNRPRKGLGVRSPLAVYTELLRNNPLHSTLIH